MLERYFVFPHTVDRIRATCIGEPIERYVERLAEGGYAERTIRWRVPLLIQFGEFARARGAKTWPELPAHAEDFVAHWSKPGFPFSKCTTNVVRASRAIDRRRLGRDRGR